MESHRLATYSVSSVARVVTSAWQAGRRLGTVTSEIAQELWILEGYLWFWPQQDIECVYAIIIFCPPEMSSKFAMGFNGTQNFVLQKWTATILKRSMSCRRKRGAEQLLFPSPKSSVPLLVLHPLCARSVLLVSECQTETSRSISIQKHLPMCKL